MRRLMLTALVVTLALMLSGSVLGFDGQRKGFVLGGGLGFTPAASWKVDIDYFGQGVVDYDENGAGVAVQFVIGGAFDEHNMLVYEGNVVGYNSDLFDESIAQGFNGAAWYHYFGETGKSFFTTLGVGFCYYKVGDYDATTPGGAILLGGGYEFSRHWQIGGFLSFGKTTDEALGLEGTFNHSHISVIVSGVAF